MTAQESAPSPRQRDSVEADPTRAGKAHQRPLRRVRQPVFSRHGRLVHPRRAIRESKIPRLPPFIVIVAPPVKTAGREPPPHLLDDIAVSTASVIQSARRPPAFSEYTAGINVRNADRANRHQMGTARLARKSHRRQTALISAWVTQSAAEPLRRTGLKRSGDAPHQHDDRKRGASDIRREAAEKQDRR